jgi:hypothetical protein
MSTGGRSGMWRRSLIADLCGRARGVALLATAVVVGCTVASGPDEIIVEHFVDYPGVAALLAEQHCAQFGKQAKLVQMGPQDTYGIGIRKRISVYHCIAGAATAPATGRGVTQ